LTPDDLILSIGAAGGSIDVYRACDAATSPRYRVQVDEATLDSSASARNSGWLSTWPELVEWLNQYPWPRLRCVSIDPSCRLDVWEALQTRLKGSSIDVRAIQQWEEHCKRARAEFRLRVIERLLPEFCRHYNCATTGFREETLERIGEVDAHWFLQALESGAVQRRDGAFFEAIKSKAKEMIFWHGAKLVSPRPITLWAEPVITIAAAGRLHGGFGWPKDRIGLQSKRNWAFDLVGYRADDSTPLVCEVKKSRAEIDALDAAIHTFLSRPPGTVEPKHSGLRNAYRKVKALRLMRPRVLWLQGPENYHKVYKVNWESSGSSAALEPRSMLALEFAAIDGGYR